MNVTPNATVGVIQARLASVRFPGKVLAELDGLPLIEFMLKRVSMATLLDTIVLAIPEQDAASPLQDIAARNGVHLLTGDERDVLSRFAHVAEHVQADVLVRLTADCPLVDPLVIDAAVATFRSEGADYLRTGLSYPDGLDVEVLSSRWLLEASRVSNDPYEREHVTPWLARNAMLRRISIECEKDLGALRLTVDEPQDLDVVRNVVRAITPSHIDIQSIAALQESAPWIFEENSGLVRDEGSRLNDAQKLWKRAKRVIPGGVSLLSKRPDMHLPREWPTYFAASKGCRIEALDGREFIDMGLMGVGTSILGFGDPRVDEAVVRAIRQGVVSSLNCPEEVWLAEKLLDLHPWAGGVRFARSGGEACAMAVRIARAASGRDRVAICGYHGWHDWYLAANISEDRALDGHLLPGLSTRGVPRALAGTALPFRYNDIDGLRKILSLGDVGAIVMEPERSTAPNPGFLEDVRTLATANGVALVFDESTSGFRKTLGGHHLTLGVNPDLAIFGKTLGNGYAITSVVGRSEIMDVVNELFISSTFWSERLGPSAALATLQAMEEDAAPKRVDALGTQFRKQLRLAMNENGAKVHFSGLPALTNIAIDGFENSAIVKTYLVNYLLERGYLAGPTLYAALPHEPELERYVEVLSGGLADVLLMGPEALVSHWGEREIATQGFSRLA
jgi:glutamate-1-semialdehyde 2,1-aminomutase